MLEIVKFIKTNENWYSILSEKPYSLIIKESDKLILFKYNQIESDLSLKICQESRGLIIEKGTFRIIRCAFFKFFNYGEKDVADIDFKSARIEEKIDGSLISLYFYEGKWNIATNGVIDAKEAGLHFETDTYKTYYDLFMAVNIIDYDSLNPEYTYTFELVSPYNRIVIPYKNTEIFHIGTRSNITLKEYNIDIGIKKPKIYRFNNIDDIIKAAKELKYDEEGYVVVDKNWNRIKIKSPAYLSVAHLKGNNIISPKRILAIIRNGEKDEILSYFPEYKNDFSDIENRYTAYIEKLENDLEMANNKKQLSRKDFALWATKKVNPDFLFRVYDNKIKSVIDYINELSIDKLFFILNDE